DRLGLPRLGVLGARSAGRLQPRALYAALVLGDVGDDVVERARRRPTGQRADLGDVGHAPVHVLEAIVVRLVVGREADLRRRRRERDYALRQLEDRHLRRGTDVEDASPGTLLD